MDILKEDAPVVKNIKPGDIINIQEEDEDGVKRAVLYEVTNVYNYMVRAVSHRRHIPRCISYGDLVILGLEWSGEGSEIIPEKARHDGPKKG